MITIFTPTYNREKTLKRLYESLRNQTSKNFEWVILDDGSQDNTELLINNFISIEKNFKIIYKKTENSGKMKAINKGISLASGEYFFIVDSDDFLSEDAIEKIETYSKELPENFGGLVFRKVEIDENGKETERNIKFGKEKIDSTPLEIFYRKNIFGDKAEIIKTEIMKKFPFPEIVGEKFFPEGYIWNRIGKKYKLRYVDIGIYYYRYLEDGYTNNFNSVMRKNPKGMRIYYSYMLRQDIPLKNKIKFFLRFLQCNYYILKK